jgi:hypothetical protein
VAHIDLYFFMDADIAILAFEMYADDISIDRAQDTVFRFGRAYPAFWDRDGSGGNCPHAVEWLDAQDKVLAVSDFAARSKYLSFAARYRAPCIANHWEYLLRPLAPLAFDPTVAVAMAQAISAGLPPRSPLVVIEDSPGHAATRMAETVGVSEYLAAHAARLAVLQWEGRALLGLLQGRGHSAAFFVNALQAATLDALAGARIEAMAPDAIARVTRLPANALAELMEEDSLMGQPVRHLAALGGVARVHAGMTGPELRARVAELR